MTVQPSSLVTWAIAGLATAGVIIRPFGWPEFVWAVVGAVLLVVFGLLGPADALTGVERGANVYLFLTGMMLLSEAAREYGFFDWLAALATRGARGSAKRLFLLVYVVGAAVTALLSNDATAVVLTPAVAAAVKTAKVEDALPYLLICAFIANSASFVLPISNPANLVVYGEALPSLSHWLAQFAPSAAISVAITYAALRFAQRRRLEQEIAGDVEIPRLSAGGRASAVGIGVAAIVLLSSSATGVALGLPTFAAGSATAAAALAAERESPWRLVRGVSWGVLPLVAGLFVLVEALDRTGVVGGLAKVLRELESGSPALAAWAAGLGVGFVANLMNNLPAGLIAGQAAALAKASDSVRGAALMGIDIGPNLSVTGSLATILWLTALRREGHKIGALSFLRIGVLAMPPALIAALAAHAFL